MTRRALVHRISANAPDDVSGIAAAIASKQIDPTGVVAVLAKTEGNGLVNDFSRGHATLALSLLIQRHLPAQQAAQICLVMSGGTEGAMAPHWLVFERRDGEKAAKPALAIGRAHTAALPCEHLGRLQQVDQVAAGVRAAMADAGIDNAADVHFVQVKCPLLVAQRIADADRRSAVVATRDTLKSMGLSRAASALGAAVEFPTVEARVELSPGDTLLLYTDGLVESRARPLDEGLERLRSAASAPPSRLRSSSGRRCPRLTSASTGRCGPAVAARRPVSSCSTMRSW